jgi:molecular chaperone HtpG
MVASTVEIITKSYKDEPAAHWTCDGSPEFTLEPADKTTRGTEIILHIAEDSLEFLEEAKIKEINTTSSCRLQLNLEQKRRKSNKKGESVDPEDKEETYKTVEVVEYISTTQIQLGQNYQLNYQMKTIKLLHELYPMQFEEPLFHIHLNVDYPFNLTGIL